MIHKVAHLLGMNYGKCYSWWETDYMGEKKKLMMGFKCSKCGDISGVHEIDGIIDKMVEDEINRRVG